MLSVNNIKNLLLTMTSDTNSNVKKIKKIFGSLQYKDEENQSLLHIFVDNKYDESKCFLAIKSLLDAGFNPNLKSDFEYNFIQIALYTGYSEDFIIKIIKEALKHNLNINHVDSDKDTIMHTAIYSDDYLDNIINIYILLCENGFDSNKVDHNNRNLLQAMIYQKQYSDEQIKEFQKLFVKQIKNNTFLMPQNQEERKEISKKIENQNISNLPKTSTNNITKEEIKELEKYGKILTLKQYLFPPTIGRDKELKNLMITLAQDKKMPLIVGESGVGKTSIVDELSYRISIGQVPNFLKNRTIFEAIPSELVAGCKYVGQFEEKMTNLMKLCDKYNLILFIDEIHTIYGIGSSEHKDTGMETILKHYIDRSNIKVIGTTTDKEYQEYFANDALKRRFEKITVQEPTLDVLYQIIDKVINDYSIKNNIFFENDDLKNKIIEEIVNITDKKNRVYNDTINNPDLVISIIDKAFAFAKFYNSEYILLEHFIESLEYCDRIYDSIRQQSILTLKSLNNSIESKGKIYKINFNNK